VSDPRVVVTIEARLAATRLPGKVMFPLSGQPMLTRLIERVRRSRHIHDVVVATTISAPDTAIVDLCDRIGCRVHRGPVEDISQRLLDAASGADLIVQITGDCPLIDPEHIDETVRLLLEHNADYASNNLEGCSFPLGFDVRAFTVAALERSITLSDDPTDRVHGSYFFVRRRDLFRCFGWEAPQELRWPELRLTVDEPADYQLVRQVFETLHSARPDFSARDVIALLHQRPDWVRLNSDVRQKLAAEG
jgi:spore coat polysaccharide biosynthesis protein SpsF